LKSKSNGFGPFTVKSPTEKLKIVTPNRPVPCRPHWRIAHRMLEVAWMSDADHAAAEYAFRMLWKNGRLAIACFPELRSPVK
jgi:hypothetical protein